MSLVNEALRIMNLGRPGRRPGRPRNQEPEDPVLIFQHMCSPREALVRKHGWPGADKHLANKQLEDKWL